MRMQLFKEINSKHNIDGYGRLLGNWFPTCETYQAKMNVVIIYLIFVLKIVLQDTTESAFTPK